MNVQFLLYVPFVSVFGLYDMLGLLLSKVIFLVAVLPKFPASSYTVTLYQYSPSGRPVQLTAFGYDVYVVLLINPDELYK